jgi:8-oxo-dGTP pyrophosphatase MutT (NUDIX family)
LEEHITKPIVNKAELTQLIHNYPTDDTNKALTLLFLESYDNFWSRDNKYGHITASCWVINHKKDMALLTHHKKLNKWFQLGGHIEAEDSDIYSSCQRELQEESGLTSGKILSREIFDIDVHKIPSKKGIAEHFHFDIRILFEADDTEDITFDTDESMLVKWMPLVEISNVSKEESISRMIYKTKRL